MSVCASSVSVDELSVVMDRPGDGQWDWQWDSTLPPPHREKRDWKGKDTRMHALECMSCPPMHANLNGPDRKPVDFALSLRSLDRPKSAKIDQSAASAGARKGCLPCLPNAPNTVTAVTKRSPVRGTCSANFSVSKCRCLVPSFVLVLALRTWSSFLGLSPCGPSHGAE